MKIVRAAEVRSTEVYEIELTEELAQECEDCLRNNAVDPEAFPHLSMQTLAQCWLDEVGNILEYFRYWAKGYSQNYQVYLVDAIREYLNDAIWGVDSECTDSEIVDWNDDVDCSFDEYKTVINSDNPDFPPLNEDDIPPEGINDKD